MESNQSQWFAVMDELIILTSDDEVIVAAE